MTKKYITFYHDLLKFGWHKTRQHAWFLFLTFLVFAIITHSVSGVRFIELIVSLMVGISIASLSLTISRDHHFTFRDLFMPVLSPRRVLNFTFFALVYLFIIFCVFAFIAASYAYGNVPLMVLGLILLIPVAYIAVRLKFLAYVVVEHENASIKDLFTMSLHLTRGHFWFVFLFILVATLFNLLGIALAGVGLFLTVPISLFAFARVYDRLKEHHTV